MELEIFAKVIGWLLCSWWCYLIIRNYHWGTCYGKDSWSYAHVVLIGFVSFIGGPFTLMILLAISFLDFLSKIKSNW